MASHKGPVERQVDAYNQRDLEAFLACYTPDTLVEDAVGMELVRGRDAMRVLYRELFDSSPNLHAEIVTRICVGDYVVDEESVRGARGASEPTRVIGIYHVVGDVIDHVRVIR